MAGGKARLPPRWFIVTAWYVHRRLVQASGGRKGLWPPRPEKWGALRLTTRGRRSGEPRSVILGYYEDGPNLVSMAMNGWGAPEPAWWLNLQADPQAVVELAGGIRREVLGRPAMGAERERLWQRWRELAKNLEGYARTTPAGGGVVVRRLSRFPRSKPSGVTTQYAYQRCHAARRLGGGVASTGPAHRRSSGRPGRRGSSATGLRSPSVRQLIGRTVYSR